LPDLDFFFFMEPPTEPVRKPRSIQIPEQNITRNPAIERSTNHKHLCAKATQPTSITKPPTTRAMPRKVIAPPEQPNEESLDTEAPKLGSSASSDFSISRSARCSCSERDTVPPISPGY